MEWLPPTRSQMQFALIPLTEFEDGAVVRRGVRVIEGADGTPRRRVVAPGVLDEVGPIVDGVQVVREGNHLWDKGERSREGKRTVGWG